MRFILLLLLTIPLTLGTLASRSAAQTPSPLEQELLAEPAEALGAAAEQHGDARRGAMLFYQQRLACAKCHLKSGGLPPLGPDLTQPEPEAQITAAYLADSLLRPSKDLRKGFQPSLLRLDDGRTVRGLVIEEDDRQVHLRDIAREGAVVRIDKQQIEARKADETSLMPEGLAGQLGGRQQFLDLVKYLLEISRHGPQRAEELEPPLALMGIRPLPDYESRVDHRGILESLDEDALKRGEAIYNLLCVNCHGTHDKPGSLPTSLRFAEGKFKRGADPYSMYLTLTHGFGQMVAQTWMVPTQKYDVIHYIRERYLKTHNPDQHFAISDSYLASLPVGDTRGPAPVKFEPWVTMDYGPTLTHTYEVGQDATNFAYKGLAVRLDEGPGGVSRGRQWMVFDEDTLRWAAGWSGEGFIDFNGIMFNGRHGIHPRVVGRVGMANPTGPGWGRPEDASFDDPRLRGRDDRPYGPLPRSWAHFKGLYHYGSRAIVSYSVDGVPVLEMPGAEALKLDPEGRGPVAFSRAINIEPRQRDLILAVARGPQGASLGTSQDGAVSVAVVSRGGQSAAAPAADSQRLDGASYVQLTQPESFKMTKQGYTVQARVQTTKDGVIFAKTKPGPRWVPDGKALFVRGGRLAFDIGWVGAVEGKSRVADGKPHHVAMTWRPTGEVALYVDGKLDAQGRLQPKQDADGHVVRLGFAAPNFPRKSAFEGTIHWLAFHTEPLAAEAIERAAASQTPEIDEPARLWKLADAGEVADTRGKTIGQWVRVAEPVASAPTDAAALVASVSGLPGAEWRLGQQGDLRLKIPAGSQPLQIVLRVATADDQPQTEAVAEALAAPQSPIDLEPLTHGGPARWGVSLPTPSIIGDDSGPLAMDILGHPEGNPWMCRVRLTGFDFFADGKQAAVCSWDGDVWRVSGIDKPEDGLHWRRIASGMFQPLGVKIIDGDIYVTCRDQITILRDLNDDGETDFYENFNNDHQVTEHFHEFAMGLQRDREGNFYYAKSARHALPALVPHHGTLLKVSPDGERTEILATGFRAANGVCLNPDGTFIVTDQEGHWNPKNRINYVKPGGFYGNMYGYHDITDSSDEAMEQPLCWITNQFDRSPAELLWVDSPKWGPLEGSLLNLSYGYGRVFIVPHEKIDGQAQGGMCQLPIPDAPTGLVRGRFHPGNGQLYTCGMFAWAGSRQEPGGLYRVRYTGRPVHLPVGLEATERGMRLTFSGELEQPRAADTSRYQVKVWDLKRTENYGSKHYNERPLKVLEARVSSDGRVVELDLEGMQPTWSMEIKYQLQGAGGEPVEGVIHNTVHRLGKP